MIQALILVVALMGLWALLAPPTAAATIVGAVCVVAVVAFSARARLVGARVGNAFGAAFLDAARAAPAALGSAIMVLGRIVSGRRNASALVLVKASTVGQAETARASSAMSRHADAYAIDADARAILVHVLDETTATAERLSAEARRVTGRAS